MILELSFFSLIIKIVFVFLLSWFAGYSVKHCKYSKSKILDWVYTSISGSCLLIISCIWASISYFPGKYGLLLPLILLILKLLKEKEFKVHFDRKSIIIIFLLIIIGVVNYIFPFIQDFSSGFYSRGGGDHSSYLTLSEWFVNNQLWVSDNTKLDKQGVTNENWMVQHFILIANELLKFKIDFFTNSPGPVANQYIATPFMSVISGRAEETYTAVVAFYLTMSGMSYALVIGELFREREKEIFKISLLLLFSPLILYIATSQAVPFLFGLSLMNSLLGVVIKNSLSGKWKIINSYHFFIIGGGLLLIYPHLYVLGLFISAIFVFILYRKVFCKKLLKYSLITFIINLLITNIFLLISIPLVFYSSSINMGGAASYSIKQILLTWTGLVDFGYWVSDIDINLNSVSMSIGNFILLPLMVITVILFVYNYKKKREVLSYILLIIFLFGMSFYYNQRGLFYQAVRFTEIGHGYLLGLVGLGLVSNKKDTKVLSALSGMLYFLILIYFLNVRIDTSKEILQPKKNTHSEYRNHSEFELVDKLAEIQKKYSREEGLIYYSGNGFGVELAGISVLFRNLRYVSSFGFDYGILVGVDNSKEEITLWDKKLLNKALIVELNTKNEIIEDNRKGVNKDFIFTNDKYRIVKTEGVQYSSLVGAYWGPLVQTDINPNFPNFRYLKNEESSLVIWANRNEKVKIEFTVYADREGGKVLVKADNKNYNFYLKKWNGNFSEIETISILKELKPGPNVITLKPYSDDNIVTWLILWKVTINSI